MYIIYTNGEMMTFWRVINSVFGYVECGNSPFNHILCKLRLNELFT